MKTNDQTKSNNKIFIIWGLFISVSVVGLLILLLLFLQPKQSQQSFNQPVEAKPIQSFSQQEQETYNAILKKIDREVDKLSIEEKIVYSPDGKIKHIKILDSTTKKEIKRIIYHDDGKTIFYIETFDSQTGKKIKEDTYKDGGKILNYIVEFNPTTGEKIKITYYNQDGTVKEEKTF
ncbi:DUF2963 domain-containing protein ['Chrysanthemum coronarium' phytoplasma]|uniref:DUF2963 domain-containing protein n=2 Tax=16SrI (Aster yellows group) TaxID=3042590 RepID=B9A0T0_ONYPH|nr:DUF2963 domain-containing protein ['Chrysanthemum coronarium' phytoplasma]BAH22130.1 hypothetical protein [Onion yellows phytoplasma]GAK74169.1 hypothetical protein OYV_06570 ['Chrysanthemum coronarium' phytoplasma]